MIDSFTLGVISLPVLIALIFLRAPIGLAMFVVGFAGMAIETGGIDMALARLKHEAYGVFSNYSLSIVPMFLLMGQFAAHSGLSARLFRAAQALIGHWRGGLAMAAIGASAGFGAICGSSLATAATMGRVALPEMRKAGYSGGLSSATLAAGGTLGILIPPSFILVIYAMLTEQNIAKLFLAAFVPGVLAALGYMAVIAVYVRAVPHASGAQAPTPWRDRLRAMLHVWPVVLLFGVVVFGIAGDWNWSKDGSQALFTPTEGAAIGAAGIGVLAWAGGNLSLTALLASLRDTASSSAMIFFIVFGAGFYNGFLALTRVPQSLGTWVGELGLAPMVVLLLILVFYLLLGCVMDSLSMIVLTVPIFWPILQGLDFGMSPEALAIWFGILVLVVVEVGLITPPVGMNLFIINSMARDVIPILETYRTVVWFVLADIIRVGLLVAVPGITLLFIT